MRCSACPAATGTWRRAHGPGGAHIFRRTVPIGIEHGTVGVLARDGVMYEVTTFRRDVETFGRHAVVEFAQTIDEDLARRDFTFNAIAWHPIHDEMRDPYGGLATCAATLRTVGEPRTASPRTTCACCARCASPATSCSRSSRDVGRAARAVPHLARLSAERVREELMVKVLGKDAARVRRAAAVRIGRRARAALYPELARDRSRAPAWSRRVAGQHRAPSMRCRRHGRCCAGRAAARRRHAGGARARPARRLFRYTGHEVIGARMAEDMMRRLKASNADTERVSPRSSRQSDLFPPDAPDAGVRRWLLHVPPELVMTCSGCASRSGARTR
jgi:tRNA nucleotidyltransferase (CCA-adding enzyme)